MIILNMVKFQNRTNSIIIILLMLSTSPLSVTYSFVDLNDYQNSRLRIILTEKLVSGKMQVRHHDLPDDFSGDYIQKIPSFEDQTPDWALYYKILHSGIVIFDGKASKV